MFRLDLMDLATGRSHEECHFFQAVRFKATLSAWNSGWGFHSGAGPLERVPAMFEHFTGDDGLPAEFSTSPRSDDSTRKYLQQPCWKVLVWASAVSHFDLQQFGLKYPNLSDSDLVKELLGFVCEEVEALYDSLKRT